MTQIPIAEIPEEGLSLSYSEDPAELSAVDDALHGLNAFMMSVVEPVHQALAPRVFDGADFFGIYLSYFFIVVARVRSGDNDFAAKLAKFIQIFLVLERCGFGRCG